MKRLSSGFLFPVLMLCVTILFFMGCETMEDLVGDAASEAITESASKTSSGSSPSAGGLVFKDGELLALWDGTPPDDGNYRLATILTPPSAETKNEAEFLFLDSGESKWTSWYFDSRKAEKSDLKIGMYVLYVYDAMAHFGPVESKEYRTGWWHYGRITSLDELYKDVVSVDGDAYQLAGIRIPLE